MNLELPAVAVEFAAAAERAFTDAGGVDLARRCEADPALRRSVLEPLLERLGAFDLAFGGDADTDVAAAELCRVAGRVALSYPLAATLSSPLGIDEPRAVVDPLSPRVDHGDLFGRWIVTGLAGAHSFEAVASDPPLRTRLGPFVVPVRVAGDDLGPADPSGPLVLGACTVLGVLERALELTVTHVSEREQFGAPLAALQAVQFQVADAAVAVHSLRELSRFTLWRHAVAGRNALTDALALRVHALESAAAVLRTCQQLHGAVGLCDEHDLSVLVRHVQPQLRQPAGLEGTTEALMDAVAMSGFAAAAGTERR